MVHTALSGIPLLRHGTGEHAAREMGNPAIPGIEGAGITEEHAGRDYVKHFLETRWLHKSDTKTLNTLHHERSGWRTHLMPQQGANSATVHPEDITFCRVNHLTSTPCPFIIRNKRFKLPPKHFLLVQEHLGVP
jgi:hypothetical protein